MSREIDLLSHEFRRKPVTVIRADISLFQSNMNQKSGGFLREVDRIAKKDKLGKVTLIAILSED